VDHKVKNVTMVRTSGDSKGFVGPHPKSQAANVSADGTDVYVNRAVMSDDDCAIMSV